MSLSEISDFAVMQASASWPEKSFLPQKSLQHPPHGGISGSGREVSLNSWTLYCEVPQWAKTLECDSESPALTIWQA